MLRVTLGRNHIATPDESPTIVVPPQGPNFEQEFRAAVATALPRYLNVRFPSVRPLGAKIAETLEIEDVIPMTISGTHGSDVQGWPFNHASMERLRTGSGKFSLASPTNTT